METEGLERTVKVFNGHDLLENERIVTAMTDAGFACLGKLLLCDPELVQERLEHVEDEINELLRIQEKKGIDLPHKGANVEEKKPL